MNKTQKEYLKSKIGTEISNKKKTFAEGKPVGPTNVEKLAALKKGGFVLAEGENYGLNYLKLPVTAVHTKNKKAIVDYNEKLNKIYSDAVDHIELGDSKDALELLKEIQDKLAKL